MAVDERARRQLRTRLQDTIGPEATDTLMEELGSLGREQLATRHDLQLGFARVERDIADLRTELKGDIAGLRTELKGDIAGLRTEMAELRTDVAERLADQTRYLMVSTISGMSLLSGISFGIARLV